MLAERDHLRCLAADKHPLEPAMAVRGHDDKVAFVEFSGFENTLRRPVVAQVPGLRRNAHLTGTLFRGTEDLARGARGRVLEDLDDLNAVLFGLATEIQR